MKKLFIYIGLVMLSLSLSAQEFEVPENYELIKAEDYKPYEQDIVACIDWLYKTPINEHIIKRQKANEFLFKWVSGSPYVHVIINAKIVTFMESSPELLWTFIGGWVKQSIVSADYKNDNAGCLAGIEALTSFYSNNKAHLKKDKNIEKYIKMKSRGTLEDFVKDNISEGT